MNDRSSVEATEATRAAPIDGARVRIDAWTETAVEVPEPRCVRLWIERHAAAAPAAPALLGRHACSYAGLIEHAKRLARRLCAQGVARGDVVAIWLRHPGAGVISCLGAWFAGAAFLPIDDELPLERVRFVLEDSAARALI